MSCACGKTASGPCGCCEGVEATTPESTYNRPGLSGLSFRIGTHSSFFETMVASLPRDHVAVREPSDPTIAVLDAWATVADVLTFYQERIANEGYLRTAIEQRSVTELGRLIGYQPRPGVAASAYLAFTLDDGYQAEIPSGTRVQSMPDPGELPQTFETSESIQARAAWNLLRPRLGRKLETWVDRNDVLHVQGADFAVRLNDLVAIEFGPPSERFFYKVKAIARDQESDRTTLSLVTWKRGVWQDADYADCLAGWDQQQEDDDGGGGLLSTSTVVIGGPPPRTPFERVVGALAQARPAASIPPLHASRRAQSLGDSFAGAAAASTMVVAEMQGSVREEVYAAWAAAPTDPSPVTASIFRISASAFGAGAPSEVKSRVGAPVQLGEWAPARDENPTGVYLDRTYEGVVAGTLAALELPGHQLRPLRILSVEQRQRRAYDLSAQVTVLNLEEEWWHGEQCDDIAVLRDLIVHAQTEPIPLAEVPITGCVTGLEIELDGLYEGLEGGRWLVVRGEPEDLPGIEVEELVMLAGCRHEQRPSGKKLLEGPHTVLVLANQLARCYRRDSVVIFGNVAHATHGESTSEVLGSGDAAVPLQRFTLRDKPVTYVSAPTPSGVESSLEVRVDGVTWPIAPYLASLGPLDRRVLVERDDDGTTRVVGGTGHRGARFSTGSENVEAAYRKGIGAAGNVGAESLKNLMTRPLGVKDVINPIRASGGADPDGRDQARVRTPIPTFALDRVVSVRDYADFALNVGGIGKAASTLVRGRGGEHVQVVIAAVGDAPLDVTSDVYQNLLAAYQLFGEAAFPVRLVIRRAVFLFMAAKVRLHEGYDWIRVEPVLRAALHDAFGFERRELGRPLYLSQVVAVMHRVRGVACIDVDAFGGIREPEGGVLTPDDVADQVAEELTGVVTVGGPEELAFFTAAVPATLILTEMKP